MSKVHNFSAGPSILAQSAFDQSIEAIKNFEGTGLSILEVSHRSKEFVQVMDDAQDIVKELLDVPEGYEVVYLGGGASTQFLMVAINLLENKAGYINTGTWASKAIKEAKLFGETQVLASSEEKGFTYIPKGYDIPEDLDYFHCTSNNTIYGTQMQEFPEVPENVKLVCDMSSDIFSRKVDVSKFDLIYAGAQKNMGPAGVTLIIVKKDILDKVSRTIPTMLKYSTHISKGSMFNTPPVFPIYVSLQNLKWVKELGGVEGMAKRNQEKADLLYGEIDSNEMFVGTAAVEDRSKMNVTFLLKDDSLNDKFLAACTEAGISGIKGHRSVGGFRASTYNALPLESVQALVDVMRNFKA
jgi:phosphoserine aminotransferase